MKQLQVALSARNSDGIRALSTLWAVEMAAPEESRDVESDLGNLWQSYCLRLQTHGKDMEGIGRTLVQHCATVCLCYSATAKCLP